MQAEQPGMLMRRFNHQDKESDALIGDNEVSIMCLRKFVELDHTVVRNPEAKRLLGTISDNLDIIERQNSAYLEQVGGNHLDAAIHLLDGGLATATDKVSADGAALLELQQKVTAQRGEVTMAEAVKGQWTMAFMLFPTVIASFIVFFIIRSLDAELRQSVEELNGGSAQIAAAANQVASSGQTLARDASQQAAMIEETSASAKEINAMAHRNIEHASTADHQWPSSSSSSTQATPKCSVPPRPRSRSTRPATRSRA